MMLKVQKAFTLVELVVLLLVIGVLAAMATQVFSSWVIKHNAEQDIKRLYSDLMRQRAYALTKGRIAGIKLINDNSYSLTEDLNDNGSTEGAEENIQLTQIKSRIRWNNDLPSSQKIEFNRLGLAEINGTIRVSDSSNAQYDCITIFATRVTMGKFDGTCKEK